MMKSQFHLHKMISATALLVLFSGACGQISVQDVQPATQTQTSQATPSATRQPLPSPTPIPATLAPTPTEGPSLCSPLAGFELADLPGLISNPFQPPPPGSDDPHQGVDFADRHPSNGVALEGREVLSILPGEVSSRMEERFPYGNALMIETRLEDLYASLFASVQIPTPAPTLIPQSALTCPTAQAIDSSTSVQLSDQASGDRSLYILYAHLQQAPNLQPGEQVTCGQGIGLIGMSGNALNPHLHVEVRVGPSGMRLQSLAHYDTSATAAEMSSYCTWRVSNLFQLVDPMRLLMAGR